MQQHWLSLLLSDVFYYSSTFSFSLPFTISAKSERLIQRRKRNWLKRKIIIHHQRRVLSVINRKAVVNRAYKAFRVLLSASTAAMMRNCVLQRRSVSSRICARPWKFRCKNINIHRHVGVDDQSQHRRRIISRPRQHHHNHKTLTRQCFLSTPYHRRLTIILWHTERLWYQRLSCVIKPRRLIHHRQKLMKMTKIWVLDASHKMFRLHLAR